MRERGHNRQKTALVTGSARGIGLSVAKTLLESGYDLVAHYHTSEKGCNVLRSLAKKRGRKITTLKANFADAASLETFIQELRRIVGEHNALDFVIHCAGVNEKKKYSDTNAREYDETFDVNLRAPIYIMRNIIRWRALRVDSSVVFVGSANEFLGGNCRSTLYTSSKSGLTGLMRNLAKELAPRTRVNAVIPGYIKTSMLYAGASKRLLAEKRKMIPLGRFGTAEETAELVHFLISDRACYITGQAIHVNGGLYFS